MTLPTCGKGVGVGPDVGRESGGKIAKRLASGESRKRHCGDTDEPGTDAAEQGRCLGRGIRRGATRPVVKPGLSRRVRDFIQRHNLILPGEKVVVAVSGGADSVSLLHILTSLQKELGTKLHVAHLDHQLRGSESARDAEHVAGLAASLGVPVTVGSRDVAAYRKARSCSTEEAARELRYDFLAGVAGEVAARRVAVGHTRDDQVETVLMHMLRGSGISGLCGLKPCSAMPLCRSGLQVKALGLLVVRPLLDVTRQETLSYCREHQLAARADSSNLCRSFLRNRLRLELLPLLRTYNPNVDQALLRLSLIASDESSFIEQEALMLCAEMCTLERGSLRLDKEKMASLPVAVQTRIIGLAVAQVLGDVRDIGANHIEAIRGLLVKPVGKEVSLPRGLVCQSGYGEVLIAGEDGRSQPPYQTEVGIEWGSVPLLRGESALEVPGETLLPGWRVLASTMSRYTGTTPLHHEEDRDNLVAEFDLHKLEGGLFVRRRQPGDRFQPLGMRAHKKLQDFMVDAKIPALWRDRIPVVCSSGGIIWLVGWRIDDKVKVTQATRELLRLEFTRLVS